MTSHPTWCDPRACEDTEPGVTVEHHDIALRWEIIGDDTTTTVGLVQIDSLDVPGSPDRVGDVSVEFGLSNALGCSDVHLTPSDARVIAAALNACAQRAERAQQAPARQTSYEPPC